ncbi:MAG TPA: PadR family transcriptional regulator [Chloroflexota bacterium]|jgi:DNA-binding PadR family transcriptional regulator
MVSIDPSETRERTHRDRGSAEPARFALLGLLLEKPAHGYDLSRRFAPNSALGDVIHLSPSHLYALLTRLERDALIAGEVQDAGNHPQRRVYRLTEAGREAVQRWIDDPVSHPRDMRIDFPLKLYIARGSGSQRVEELVDRQRVVFEEYIARLEAEVVPADSGADAAFIRLMRIGRIGRAQAALDWLELCLDAE